MPVVASTRATDQANRNPLGAYNTRFKGSLSPASPGHDFLFDHLVGAGEQRRGHIEAKRLGGLEVDHQFDQVLGLVAHAIEGVVDVSGRTGGEAGDDIADVEAEQGGLEGGLEPLRCAYIRMEQQITELE